MRQEDREVRELTLSFERFSLRLTVAVIPNSDGVEVTAAPSAPASASSRGGVSRAAIERLLNSSGPDDLAAVSSPQLLGLQTQLRGTDAVWTPAARIGRAFRAGVIAARRLEGIFCDLTSPSIPYRNQVYVVLRGPNHPEGCWTTDYNLYLDAVGEGTTGGFARQSVSHAFPSHAEAEAYLAGAGQVWPRQMASGGR
eukprot:Skav215458  [mRNA]  locus=scaffold1025:78612:79202:+ [translate_table: standard]